MMLIFATLLRRYVTSALHFTCKSPYLFHFLPTSLPFLKPQNINPNIVGTTSSVQHRQSNHGQERSQHLCVRLDAREGSLVSMHLTCLFGCLSIALAILLSLSCLLGSLSATAGLSVVALTNRPTLDSTRPNCRTSMDQFSSGNWVRTHIIQDTLQGVPQNQGHLELFQQAAIGLETEACRSPRRQGEKSHCRDNCLQTVHPRSYQRVDMLHLRSS